MGGVNVGHLHKKRIVRNMNGDIIDWLDETDGGWIIRRGQVVNQAKIDEIHKKEEDRKLAAQAILHQKVDETAPDRTASPSKVDSLEKRIDAQDAKLDAILAALKK